MILDWLWDLFLDKKNIKLKMNYHSISSILVLSLVHLEFLIKWSNNDRIDNDFKILFVQF